jgi:hypothetical protein
LPLGALRGAVASSFVSTPRPRIRGGHCIAERSRPFARPFALSLLRSRLFPRAC